MVQALSYTGDFAAWRRLARRPPRTRRDARTLLLEWAPRVAYVLSVTVLLL
jgi:hypothetical protein